MLLTLSLCFIFLRCHASVVLFLARVYFVSRDGDLLAQKGQLDLLKSGQAKEFSAAAMDLAAANGHLEVVKWLHDTRTEGCT